MKAFAILATIVFSASAFAKVNSEDYGCHDLRAKVDRNGVLFVNDLRMVPSQGGGDYCFNDEGLTTVWVKTKDFSKCPMNTCSGSGQD